MSTKGESPLLAAAAAGDVASVKRLLKGGADPNAKSLSRCNATPLQLACTYGHFIVAELLLEADADPNAAANGGFTAAHRACAWAREEVLLLLLDYDAELTTIADDAGRTPLDELCRLRKPSGQAFAAPADEAAAVAAMRERLCAWAEDDIERIDRLLLEPAAENVRSVYEERLRGSSDSLSDFSDSDLQDRAECEARLARFSTEAPPVRDDGRCDEEREDLADDLLCQPAPWRVRADPPLSLRYLLRHEAVAWCVHDDDGQRHWMPYCAGRRRAGEEEDSDF
eukprot:g4442.t1